MDSHKLREEVWYLKMELEDAKEAFQIKSAQADAQAAQIQRLRSEVCTKELQLNEARRILDGTLKDLRTEMDAAKTSQGIGMGKPDVRVSMYDGHEAASHSVSDTQPSPSVTLLNPQASSSYTMINTPQAPTAFTTLPSSILPLIPQELPAESITDTRRDTAPVANGVDGRSLGKRTVSQGQQERDTGKEEFTAHMAKRLKPSEHIGLLTTLAHLRSEHAMTSGPTATASARPSKIVVIKYNKNKFVMRRRAEKPTESVWNAGYWKVRPRQWLQNEY